jgi:hypothetical protein
VHRAIESLRNLMSDLCPPDLPGRAELRRVTPPPPARGELVSAG